MRIESILSKNIDAMGDKAAYDAACKRLLANKVILAWIMKECLEEYRNCNIQEIVSRYIDGEPDIGQVPVNVDERLSGEQIRNVSVEDASVYEGTVTYDIRFAIEMTKTLESEVSTMCNLSKGVEEKGIEKGILFSIKSLMETVGWSAEQAMGGLKIPESERDKLITELKNEKL